MFKYLFILIIFFLNSCQIEKIEGESDDEPGKCEALTYKKLSCTYKITNSKKATMGRICNKEGSNFLDSLCELEECEEGYDQVDGKCVSKTSHFCSPNSTKIIDCKAEILGAAQAEKVLTCTVDGSAYGKGQCILQSCKQPTFEKKGNTCKKKTETGGEVTDLISKAAAFWSFDETQLSSVAGGFDFKNMSNNQYYLKVDNEKGDASLNIANSAKGKAMGPNGNASIYSNKSKGAFIRTAGTPIGNSASYSVSFWIRPKTTPRKTPFGTHSMVFMNHGSNSPRGAFYYDNYGNGGVTSFAMRENAGSGKSFYFSMTKELFKVGHWQMVTGTFNGLTRVFTTYYNGNIDKVYKNVSAKFKNWVASEFIVGAGNDKKSIFPGEIDEMGVWRRELSQAEIKALYSLNYTTGSDDGGGGAEHADAIQSLFDLGQQVSHFKVLNLPKTGQLELKRSEGLVARDLQGLDLDEVPPVLNNPNAIYRDILTDTFAPGAAPYVAKSIRPFRFKYFHNEFSYAGHHTFKMVDYASVHGFDTIIPYVRKRNEFFDVLPDNTSALQAFGFQREFFTKIGVEKHRYDQIVWNSSTEKKLRESLRFSESRPEDHEVPPDYLMLDIEESVLKPEDLRQRPWYPSDQSKRASFEKKYYDSYALIHTKAVESMRSSGYKNISIYGWYPYGRTWGGLEQVEAEAGVGTAWDLFGKQIHDSVDLINNSVYCFYWSPKNVAYVLRNIDLNMEILKKANSTKPVIPYFWDRLHGGGGGWRWWQGQPLPTEEQRAIIAMSFFTGIDGLTLWNWSGTTNPHRIPDLYQLAGTEEVKKVESTGFDFMIKESFSKAQRNSSKVMNFKRYDAIRITGRGPTSGSVTFQKIKINSVGNNFPTKEIGASFPSYLMDAKELANRLRPSTSSIASTIEGLALVRPFEKFLKESAVKIDQDTKLVFKNATPIVRRKKLGDYHLIITYNPKYIHGSPSVQKITLNNFDGVSGLTLVLPADDQVRIFAVKGHSE